MDKKVSVIMCFYKEPIEFVDLAVRSILEQSYKNLEIIFILDNPDNKIIELYLKEIEKNDKRVKLSINDKNLGLVKSLNKALEKCSGEYIARMDADDISYPNRIEKELNYLVENNLDLVGCNTEDIDQLNNVKKQTIYPESDKQIKKYLKYASAIAHPTWFANKKVYDILQGYRNIEACEDYDFLVRASLYGIKMGVLQEVLFKYRINENGISFNNKVIQKNNMRFIRKKYRNNKSFSMVEYGDYLNGRKYKRLRKKMERFYSFRNKQKQNLNNRFLFLLWGIIAFFSSSIAIENIYDCLKVDKIARDKNRGI